MWTTKDRVVIRSQRVVYESDKFFIALAFGPLITLGTVVAMSSSLPMFDFLYEPYLLPSLLILFQPLGKQK